MQLSKPIWFQGWVKQLKQLIIFKGKGTCTDSFHCRVEEGCYSHLTFRCLLQPKRSRRQSSMPMWQSEFLCTDFIMDSFSKSTRLFANILLPSISSLPPFSPPSLPSPSLLSKSLFCFLETGSYHPAQTELKFVVIFLPPAPHCWRYRHVSHLNIYF